MFFVSEGSGGPDPTILRDVQENFFFAKMNQREEICVTLVSRGLVDSTGNE